MNKPIEMVEWLKRVRGGMSQISINELLTPFKTFITF